MKGQTFKVNVNEMFDFEGLDPRRLDIVRTGDGKFHILKDSRSYHAELLHADHAAKAFTVTVNGNIYQVQLADVYDQLVRRLGLSESHGHKVREIRAPMPGLVLDILVETGREVQKGDPLVVLEAMKMENIIKSSGEGVVKIIHVAKGTPVEKGLLLIEME
jgi:biotin carboxyl carrier protein